MLNKGLVVKNVLGQVRDMEGDHGTNFILCIGDDISDEKMFKSVFSHLAESTPPQHSSSQQQQPLPLDHIQPDTSSTPSLSTSNSTYAYTVTVGKKPSHASYYVGGAAKCASLLMQVTGQLNQHGRAMSWDTADTSDAEIFE